MSFLETRYTGFCTMIKLVMLNKKISHQEARFEIGLGTETYNKIMNNQGTISARTIRKVKTWLEENGATWGKHKDNDGTWGGTIAFNKEDLEDK
jgi:hypothetical protein